MSSVNCRHPKDRWALRWRALRGKRVRVAVCLDCGETQVSPSDAARFLEKSGIPIAADRG